MFSMFHWKKETEHKEIGHWYRTKLTDSIMLVGIDENSYNCATLTIDLGDVTLYFFINVKVQLFWKSLKHLGNLLHGVDTYKTNLEEDCATFCGLSRKAELYQFDFC